MSVTPFELATIAATAADDKKAHEICVLDLTELSDVCDYFVICTGDNAPMVDAIVDEVREKVRKYRNQPSFNRRPGKSEVDTC